VATIVVLIGGKRGPGAIQSSAAAELARLGVTSIAVLQDDLGTGVVLEGWAFDPGREGDRATAIVAGDRGRVRTLRPLLQAAISAEQVVPDGALAPADDRSAEPADRGAEC